MGKDDKEDSGFGFKDRAKAEETLRLLQEHEPNYRRLTVRGLLGRAKRVLSLTKAEDKIKNIKEAMDVFETWLAELDLNKKTETKDKKEPKRNKDKDNGEKDEDSSDVEMEEKPEKKELPSDKVPNLGFKDPEAVAATFKELQGRDPEYQKFAVKGLIGSANRVLTSTKDETKLANIKEAIQKFEKFLDDFETKHLMKQHNPYISLGIVRSCLDKTDAATSQQKAFIAAYASVNGEYKRLRTVKEKDGGKTWDIVRNAALKGLKEKYQGAKLFNDDDEPTKEHLELLLWAYSPEASKVKKVIPEKKEQKEDTEKRDSRKRKSSARDESPSKKQKDD